MYLALNEKFVNYKAMQKHNIN